jgi:hypothetical protein
LGRFVAGAASFKFFKMCGILAWMWLLPLSQSLSDFEPEEIRLFWPAIKTATA